MTMHSSVFFKGNQGFVPNQQGPRWIGLGSPPPPPPPPEVAADYGDPFLQSKLTTSLELSAGPGRYQFSIAKDCEDHQAKGITTHQFNLFSDYDLGDCRSAENAAKTNLQTNVSLAQSATTIEEDQAPFKLGFGQPLICAQYPYGDHQYYGVYSTFATQIAGRMMLPLSIANDGPPIFVNPKQYNAIMRRRKCRAKAEMANQVLKSRKPYLHFSRHLHAKRRPRGNGGRFLNTKKLSTDEEEKQNDPKSTGSQVSEVVQLSNGLVSEVTSPLLTTTSHQPFEIDHLLFKPFPVNYDAENASFAVTSGGGYLKV